MKYHCKYPNKLTIKGYLQKKFEEYKSSGQYLNLFDGELKTFLGYIILKIHLILSCSKEKLQQHLELLLKIDSISKQEFLAITEDWEESNSAGALCLIMHDSTAAIDVISNNLKKKFRSDMNSHYERFLRDATVSCIKDVTAANQVNSTIKKVRFEFDDAAISKSENRPKSLRKTFRDHDAGTKNYQYDRHKSLVKEERKTAKGHKRIPDDGSNRMGFKTFSNF